MSRNVEVYELGNVEGTFRPSARPTAAPPKRGRKTRLLDERFGALVAAVVRSLSLFAPGTTQVLRGQVTLGAFYASSLVFLGSLAWALLETLERLAVTLDVLGQSVSFVFWTLGVVYVLSATAHLAAIWTAMEPGPPDRRHPVVSGVASALLPGWGQLLNGDRTRAVMFVGALWVVAAAWLASSTSATALLNTYVPIVTPLEQSARAPFLLWTAKWTLPFAIWALAVYDAVASAVTHRR